jgi:hypothetical protein
LQVVKVKTPWKTLHLDFIPTCFQTRGPNVPKAVFSIKPPCSVSPLFFFALWTLDFVVSYVFLMFNTIFFEILLILCICFFQDIYAKYMFYLDTKSIITKKIPNTINPDWNFTQLHATPKCTQEVSFYDSQP